MLPTLAHDRFVLRPFRAGDASDLQAHMQDPATVRWMAIDLPYTLEDAAGFIAGTDSAWENRTAAHFAIADPDDRLIGYLGVLSTEEPMRAVEVGYWVSAANRGSGIATAALRLAVDWVKSEIVPDRIELGMLAGNDASRRVAERAGFVYTGSKPSGKLLDGLPTQEWIFELRS